jgi:hypothetical protein
VIFAMLGPPERSEELSSSPRTDGRLDKVICLQRIVPSKREPVRTARWRKCSVLSDGGLVLGFSELWMDSYRRTLAQ